MTTQELSLSPGSEAPTPSASPPARSSRRIRRSGAVRTHPGLWLFPLPALALYTFFFALPTLQAVQYAVTDWDGFSADYRNVGVENFTDLLTGDSLFWGALSNTMQFLLVVVIAQTVLSLALSVFLTRNSKSSVLLRALFFFPSILSSVSVAFVWKFVYDPDFGLANQALGAVGLDALQSSYLGNPDMAIHWVAVTQVWFHTGQMMVIFVAGLQQIPRELYESAEMDGTTRWQRFRHVTWPLIAPATAIVMAYTTIQAFKAFDLILGLGGNPPKESLDILSTRIYTTFANSQFGYTAAESILFMIMIALVTVAQRRAVRLLQPGV